jgi:hypothetical protein
MPLIDALRARPSLPATFVASMRTPVRHVEFLWFASVDTIGGCGMA